MSRGCAMLHLARPSIPEATTDGYGGGMKIVVLDDYQRVARSYADFDRLSQDDPGVTVEVLHEHIDDQDALVTALSGAAVVVAMRERTPFPAALFDRLPDLRLLVSTGMRNAAIDLA